MTIRSAFAMLALAALVLPASAQHPAPAASAIPPEARQHDFLLGQWELTVKVPARGLGQKIHGVPKLAGVWKAWRAFAGYGIEDELSITDAAGNPLSLSHSMRLFDRGARQWSITTLDVYRAKFSPATAQWKDGIMTQTSRGTDPEGKAFLGRSRFSDITPTSFRFRQDRSYDEGRKWVEGALTIEAKRVTASAPR